MPEINQITDPQPHLRDSLEKVRPEMAALSQDQLLPINTDPFIAASIARAAMPQISILRPLLEKLPGFDVKLLDKIELYAFATIQAQSNYQATSAPPAHLQELVTEATALRQTFLSDVTAATHRGLLDGSKLDELKGPIGHRNVASDLLMLTTIIRFNWAKLSGKTAITAAELDRAELLGEQLSFDIGQKTTSPAITAAVSLERQQAFTLLAQAYDEVRRAVTFLRWSDDDADEIAPSFYALRKKRSGTETKDKTDSAPATTPSTAAPANATPAVNTAAAKPAVGLPGADPFVH